MSEAIIARELERAASYRFLSLLFVPPSAEVGAELRALAPSVHPALSEDAALAGERTDRSLEGLYHRVLGPSGQVPDTECAYDDNGGVGRGVLIGDVAGFYAAFAYAPAAPGTADHIASELGFLGWLAMKLAYAHHAGLTEEVEITESARAAFLRDHAGRWMLPFLERLAAVADGTHYEALATLAARSLRALEGEKAFARPRARLPLVTDEPDELECG